MAERGRKRGCGMQKATPVGLIHRWLKVPVSAAWVAVFAVTIAFLVVGLPARLDQLSTPCSDTTAPADTTCAHYQLSEVAEQVLIDWGLSLSTYGWFMTVLTALIAPLYLLIALVIFLRNRGQLVMLLPAFGLLLFVPGYFASISEAITHAHPGWLAPLGLIRAMAIWIAVVFGFTFPSGTFFPGWTRPLTLVTTLTVTLLAFYPTARLLSTSGPQEAYWLSIATVVLLAAALWAQISRYRRVSSVLERQQTKWVVFGFSALVLEIAISSIAQIVLPRLIEPGRFEVFYALEGAIVSAITAVVLAVSFAVAILRYRLFDIDVIINRTLVYSALSLSLAAIYVSGILLGEFLLRPFRPESSLAVAISTLAVAALFQPIRRRIQADVDRRFFRRKYSAERTIAEFRTVARDVVDLGRLRAELIQVTHETMQPSHVSLWLRER